jgi:membrane protein DedA with SNARE-associated domain
VPQWLADLFARYGYAVVFTGVFLENTGFPVPGETALLAGAALARSGRLSLPLVVTWAMVGAIAGDNLGFMIGRRGGRVLAERYGSRFGLTQARLKEFDRFFARHGAKTVLIARFVTGLRVVCAILAGGSDMPWPKFLFFNVAGAVAWATAIGAAGYSLAYSWEALQRAVGVSGALALVVVVILAALAVGRLQRE